MKRASTRKTDKEQSKRSDMKDLKPAKAEQVKGGGKMVVNTYRYDPYKAARFH